MYNAFYGFKESPFNLTPNSRFFYASDKHAEALSSLIYAVNERKGFIVITGEIGSGKTTVTRALLNKLDARTDVALISNTHLGSRDLLMAILDDLEIEYKPGPKARLLSQFTEYLIRQLKNRTNVVLIIDEAQNLKPSVLEEVRMLSNLETESEKLIQIILIGQPELQKKLALAQLEQLRQRVAVYYHLRPLDQQETRNYILHRLRVASGSGQQYFTDGAIDLIYRFSLGVPRIINHVCDQSLLSGYIDEKKTIDEQMVQQVIQDSPMVRLASGKKSSLDTQEALI
ncbi:MAG: AAA family ATPase [Candidatus Omnitrophica bacterium]|nr:AAA family ATPase [Candidatus Omnitrophota bacterium]MDE2009679.1 AAA family ATPase [Candidatus Omnitrophota bacterium]MDE2214393.1 AAA family ATPase [Candidatus Omnitrophota bacterium]MDE2231533.1 AAA family ATPase [Candidatus Omnitrophota bacterium]